MTARHGSHNARTGTLRGQHSSVQYTLCNTIHCALRKHPTHPLFRIVACRASPAGRLGVENGAVGVAHRSAPALCRILRWVVPVGRGCWTTGAGPRVTPGTVDGRGWRVDTTTDYAVVTTHHCARCIFCCGARAGRVINNRPLAAALLCWTCWHTVI